MIKKLQLANPFIKYEPIIDTVLYIIQNDLFNYKFALVENFIDTIYYDNAQQNISFFYPNPYMEFNCFTYNRLLPDISKLFINNLSDFIVKSLDMDYYVTYIPDIFYLDEYELMSKNHRTHEILFYGYDTTNKTLIGRDYFNLSDSYDKNILMETLNKTFRFYSNETYSNHIHVLKLDPLKKRKINKTTVIKKLESFITNEQLGCSDNKYYGIVFFDVLEKTLLMQNGLPGIDIKHYHFIYVHIKLMLERVKLIEIEYNICLDIISHELIELNNLALILRNMIIKSNISKNNYNVDYSLSIINSIKNRYIKVINKLIFNLYKL